MNPADYLLALEVMFDVTTEISADGKHLRLKGNPLAISCATPRLMKDKAALLKHLHATRHNVAVATTSTNGDGK